VPVDLTLNDLLDYSDWERRKWFDWMSDRGNGVLTVSTGLHGDGRFATVGELVGTSFRPRNDMLRGSRNGQSPTRLPSLRITLRHSVNLLSRVDGS
jgi:hypothetical protein